MGSNIVSFLIVHAAIIIPLVLAVLLIISRPVRLATCTVLRVIARPLLLLAVVALVYDGTRTLAGGSGLVITSLSDHWQSLHPASLQAFKTLLNGLHPSLWDAGGQRIVKMPAWAVAGVIGLTLAWIGRKRRQLNVYVN